MSDSNSKDKEYIFQKDKDGRLNFVGDFEGYYKEVNDPWEQAGGSDRMGSYYNYSRENLVQMLEGLVTKDSSLLEVGCGLGHVAEKIKTQFDVDLVSGMDISETAIQKARKLYSELEFCVGDITSTGFGETHTKKYDVIIMNQLLWYILEDLEQVFDNLHQALNRGGHLVFVNAFMFEQSYGADKVNGFDGLVRYVSNTKKDSFTIVEAKSYFFRDMEYIDGILILTKM